MTKRISKTFRFRNGAWSAAFAVLGLLSFSSLMHASAFGPTVTPDGSGGYVFDYSLAPDSGSTFEHNDFFVIYDVPAAAIKSLSAPSGWNTSESLSGPNPSYGAPGTDDPTIENVVFTYTGSASISNTTPVSGFDIDSPWNAQSINWFGVQYNGANGNSISLFDAPATPEPVSLGLAGLGLGALVLIRRLRRA